MTDIVVPKSFRQPLFEKLEMFEVDSAKNPPNVYTVELLLVLLYKFLYTFSVLLTNSKFGGTRLQTALTFRLMGA